MHTDGNEQLSVMRYGPGMVLISCLCINVRKIRLVCVVVYVD